ncbi:MAG: hypothetical protein ABIP65_03670 [Vicinamibacterales bacterium]
MTSSETRKIDSPRISVTDIQRLAAAQLSLPSRVGHALLLAVSLTMAAAVGSLWATEPWLPARTHIAFALIVSMGLAWAVFAAWVLARRRVLLGTDRVVAARMGLAFSAVCTLGMLAVGYWGGAGRPAYLAALVESPLCVVAAVVLVNARRRVETLSRRRMELERQLGVEVGRTSA